MSLDMVLPGRTALSMFSTCLGEVLVVLKNVNVHGAKC